MSVSVYIGVLVGECLSSLFVLKSAQRFYYQFKPDTVHLVSSDYLCWTAHLLSLRRQHLPTCWLVYSALIDSFVCVWHRHLSLWSGNGWWLVGGNASFSDWSSRTSQLPAIADCWCETTLHQRSRLFWPAVQKKPTQLAMGILSLIHGNIALPTQGLWGAVVVNTTSASLVTCVTALPIAENLYVLVKLRGMPWSRMPKR